MVKTVSLCSGCGQAIPESLPDDALCVGCRYRGPKPKAQETALDADGNPRKIDIQRAEEAMAMRLWRESGQDGFSDSLLDSGLDPLDVILATKAHEAFLTRFASLRAMEVTRAILTRIAQTKTGKTAEFQAILSIFTPDRDIAEIAAEAGMSRQSVWYQVQKLKPLLTETLSVGGTKLPKK